MPRKSLAGAIVVAGTLATSTAFAAESRESDFRERNPNSVEVAAMHEDVCKDHYARAAGRMGFLEARLALTPSQHALFDAWKGEVLQRAQVWSSACASEPMTSSPLGLLARKEHQAARLKMRLASLEAEMPTLSALYRSLTPEQKHALDFSGYGRLERPGRWYHQDVDDDLHQESH